MGRAIAVFCGALVLLLITACSAPSPEPAAPGAESTAQPSPAESDAGGETEPEGDGQQPAKPAIVDFGEVEPGDEDNTEEAPMEAPAPGGRDAETMLVEQARQALADRLAVTPGEITTGSVEDVTWPDTGLGCPDPEMTYLQVLTPGYRIVLIAGENEYIYHTSRDDRIVLCGPDGHPLE